MDWKKIAKDRRMVWIGLGVIAVLIRFVLSSNFIEKFYSRGLFVFIRKAADFLTGLVPFALVYILFFFLLGIFIIKVWRFFKLPGQWRRKLGSALFSFFAFSGGVVFLFMILWGYNYDRLPLEKQLGINPEPLSIKDLRVELDSSTVFMSNLRANLKNISDSAITAVFLPTDLENTMRSELIKVLRKHGYPTPGNVRGKLLKPKGLLLRIGTAGVYIPFTAEGHIDAGLHALQLPFVIAHEMAHGYGFGDEGTCNFLAWLACVESDDPVLNYVGQLAYWRYLASNYRWYEPEVFSDFFESRIPEGIKNDIRAIYEEMDKYPDILPGLRDAAYNAYLRAQGIEEGMENYSRILMLVKAWKEREK